MLCEEKFFQIYSRLPEGVSFSPYRICPIGAHIDHNLGKITGLAINKGINLAYGPKKNGVIEMMSLQFPKRGQWHIREVGPKMGDWADYLRGATWVLTQKFNLRYGLCGVVEGSLPVSGLSSSSAIILAFLNALCKVNFIEVTAEELIEMAHKAENEYIGVNSGTLDQNCEVLSLKDHLLYMDCKDNSYEVLPCNEKMKPFGIGIFFSGLEHSLANSQYNVRVDELRSAVYALEAFSGMPYGRMYEANARDVSYEVYETFKEHLPKTWRLRCEHFYSEYRRVEEGAAAWKAGDLEKFGELIFESGWSSIHNWESGAPEQIKLYEILRETDGVYGARFSGAGFKGCCMGLVDPGKLDQIQETVRRKYVQAFPYMEARYSFNLCESCDGIGVTL